MNMNTEDRAGDCMKMWTELWEGASHLAGRQQQELWDWWGEQNRAAASPQESLRRFQRLGLGLSRAAERAWTEWLTLAAGNEKRHREQTAQWLGLARCGSCLEAQARGAELSQSTKGALRANATALVRASSAFAQAWGDYWWPNRPGTETGEAA